MKKNHSLISFYLTEIKWRGFYIIISFGLTFILSFFFSNNLLLFFTDAFNELNFGEKLIYTDMTEGMITNINIWGFFSLWFSSFFLLYQYWAFIVSSYTKTEQLKVNLWLILIISSLISSWLLCFHWILPFSWKFFTSFQLVSESINIQLEPRFQSYCHSIYLILFACIIIHISFFSLILCLCYRFINFKDFPQRRKYCILGFLLVSALIAPPEIISQLILFLAIFFLYEFLIFFSLYIKNLSVDKDF